MMKMYLVIKFVRVQQYPVQFSVLLYGMRKCINIGCRCDWILFLSRVVVWRFGKIALLAFVVIALHRTIDSDYVDCLGHVHSQSRFSDLIHTLRDMNDAKTSASDPHHLQSHSITYQNLTKKTLDERKSHHQEVKRKKCLLRFLYLDLLEGNRNLMQLSIHPPIIITVPSSSLLTVAIATNCCCCCCCCCCYS
jgi:hypothetical protein